MAKIKIKDFVSENLSAFLAENNLELWNVEFVKEVKDWFLRVYIDKAQGAEEEYLSIDECEKVSRYLSEILDEKNPIEQNYYLEVSSPGLDRELITEDHYNRYIGSQVDMKLYKALDGKKELHGCLAEVNPEDYVIEEENGNKITIEKSQVARTKLAVIF